MPVTPKIKSVFDASLPTSDFAKTIKTNDSSRKVVGISSLRAKIAAAQHLLNTADEMAIRASEAVRSSPNEDSPDLYLNLEGAWACLEEMMDLFNLGQVICKRVAGEMPILPIDKFAKDVVSEDEKSQ